MKVRKSISILFIAFVAISTSCKRYDLNKTHIDLNSNWLFCETNTENWYPAKIPGTVLTDLLNLKLIDDPYIGTNEQKIQSLENKNWSYKTTFNLNKNVLQLVLILAFS